MAAAEFHPESSSSDSGQAHSASSGQADGLDGSALKKSLPSRRQESSLEYYARRASSEAHSYRRLFSRDNIFGFVKSMAWVIPLTLLIWIYAEREQVKSEPNVKVQIEVPSSSSPNQAVTLLNPQDHTVIVTLSGPQFKVDNVKEGLLHGAHPPAIPLPASLPAGRESSISVLEYLHGWFRNQGVNLESCTPENLDVMVDSIDSYYYTVETPKDLPSLQSCHFDPPNVLVRGPDKVFHDLQDKIHVVAQIAGRPELNDPGIHNLSDVRLTLSVNNPALELQQPTLQATITVKDADITMELKNLSVRVMAPVSILDNYHVKCQAILPSVTVKGPPAAIEQLREGGTKYQPYAALPVSSDDANNPAPQRDLMILGLPDGVSVVPSPSLRWSYTFVTGG